MELKIYLRILLKRWWIILTVFLITFTATLVFTLTQVSTYETTATFVVAPNAPAEATWDTKMYGIDSLSRQAEIGRTYAEVATSRQIRQEAVQALNLSRSQAGSLSIQSNLRSGTNVLEITADGNDPVLAANFANKVGEKTMDYVEKLYQVYDLKPLDQAVSPTVPVGHGREMNLALGVVLGLTLGVGLAFLVDYLQTPLTNMVNQGLLDSESGAYSLSYFAQRLGEEMSRASRNKYPLSLALVNVDQLGTLRTSLPPQFQSEALHKITTFLKQYLRDEDVVARLEGTVFAILLPDVSQEQAKTVIEKLQTRMAWTDFEIENSGAKLNLSGVAGIVAYNFNGTGQTELLNKAKQALQQAETAGFGKVIAVSDDKDHGQA